MSGFHGGDTVTFETEYGIKPLDFSANINPLGMPEAVKAAIIKAAESADIYPDPECRRLRAALAERLGVPMDRILCGGGAADLIYRAAFALRPRTALLTAPTFSEYEAALKVTGCQIERHILKKENLFDVYMDFADKIRPETDAVFLCNPNNPTGRLVMPNVLDAIVTRCHDTDTMLIADESFLDFCPGAKSLIGSNSDKILVIRSFTKIFALAGVRLGYCVSGNETLLDKMKRAGPPWSVSSIAQSAGLAALTQCHFISGTLNVVEAERKWMYERLNGLGLFTIQGSANYLLFQSDTLSLKALAKKGIMIRPCGDYFGLDDSWFRIAVRKHEDNLRLIRAIEEALNG